MNPIGVMYALLVFVIWERVLAPISAIGAVYWESMCPFDDEAG